MSLENIMQIAGMSMDAQTVRMNLAVSNVSNADTVSDSPTTAYKAKRPVFKTVMESEVNRTMGRIEGGVRIDQVAEDQASHPSCLLYTSPSPRDRQKSRMPSSA